MASLICITIPSIVIYLILSVNPTGSQSTRPVFLEPKDIAFVILSQKEDYHAAHADILRKSIDEQASLMDKQSPQIILTHELNIKGSWTIVPILVYLSDKYPEVDWFFFCLENTTIRLNKLLGLLSRFDAAEEQWIGHALYNNEPTIVHHFADYSKKFKYPHIVSGFAMTISLIDSLAATILNGEDGKIDFSIDASYEFANFVFESKGMKLKHVPEICIVSGPDCATYPKFFQPCGLPIPLKNIYFAIKTCAKFHIERIPVIKQTWAKYAVNIGFFSDTADNNLTEAYVVSNTTEGHCAKTYDILKQVSIILKNKKLDWLVISDDDTIFSVARLTRLLTCYYPKKLIALGERYGFRLWDHIYGYEYLTGGAGLVLSAPAVHAIIKSELCKCPMATAPDDMYLFGICLVQTSIQLTHSLLFHQARPSDYATAYLATQEPVSFHKFWMIDPVTTYNEWFAEVDDSLYKSRTHTEL